VVRYAEWILDDDGSALSPVRVERTPAETTIVKEEVRGLNRIREEIAVVAEVVVLRADEVLAEVPVRKIAADKHHLWPGLVAWGDVRRDDRLIRWGLIKTMSLVHDSVSVTFRSDTERRSLKV